MYINGVAVDGRKSDKIKPIAIALLSTRVTKAETTTI